MRLTEQVHASLRQELKAGDSAIDATLGNGYDTQFLCKIVGGSGHVWGFDIQDAAIEATQQRLQASDFDNYTLVKQSHADMLSALPMSAVGKVQSIVFNLGYLPGQDKAITTQSKSTLAALEQAHTLLKPGGSVQLLCYTGHESGLAEWHALDAWTRRQAASQWTILFKSDFDEARRPPVWFELRKPK